MNKEFHRLCTFYNKPHLRRLSVCGLYYSIGYVKCAFCTFKSQYDPEITPYTYSFEHYNSQCDQSCNIPIDLPLFKSIDNMRLDHLFAATQRILDNIERYRYYTLPPLVNDNFGNLCATCNTYYESDDRDWWHAVRSPLEGCDYLDMKYGLDFVNDAKIWQTNIAYKLKSICSIFDEYNYFRMAVSIYEIRNQLKNRKEKNIQSLDRFVCVICYVNHITHFLVCGHTYCENCIYRINGKCPMCKSEFSETMNRPHKIY